jgi:hypothetical protein
MSISQNKYIDASSGVGGATAVGSRELILRIITPSASLLPGELRYFNNLAEVAEIFAENTPEYRYAVKYFGFVSKLSTGARRLSMARWAKAATAPIVQGSIGIFGADRLANIILGDSLLLTVESGGVASDFDVELDLSGLTTYEAVRAQIQAAIRAESNAQLAQATVLYTASTGQFTLTGGVTTEGDRISVRESATPELDVGALIGWTADTGASYIAGFGAQTPVQAITVSAESSDNFGTFGFIDSTSNPPARLTADEVAAVAEWNHAQNNKFMYLTPGTVAEMEAAFNRLRGFSGTGYSISGSGYDYAEFCPAEVLATTDYTRVNASSNYMYQSFGNRVPQITTTPLSDRADGFRANYVGETMINGQGLAFYQRGTLMGDATAAVDMNVYANEMWFKSEIVAALMNAFMGLPSVPANDTGRALLLANLQSAIDAALNNGTISVGKLLTATQRAYVTLATNDPDAWQQIQNIGYWVNITIEERVTTDGRTEYYAKYLLLYSKDDQVRKVEGTDTLI